MSAPATSATSSGAPASILLGPTVARILDPELSAVQHAAVHRVDRVLGVAVVVVAHEREAAALLLVRVARDVHVSHVAVLLEHAFQHVRRRAVRQIVHFQRDHALGVRRSSAVTHFCGLRYPEMNAKDFNLYDNNHTKWRTRKNN